MLTLAIDCALRRINLAASDAGIFLGELSADVGTRQSELLPGAVRDFLSLLGRSVGDVGRVAVTKGPGYYTGIRVGLSYAAALAESVGAKVRGVSTLRAMAVSLIEWSSASHAPIAITPIIPASRGTLYAAMYEASAGGGVKILMEQSHVKTEDLPGIIRNIRPPDETVLTSTEASAPLSGGYRFIPSARVGWGVLSSAHDERSLDPGEVRAVYLRPPY